MSTRFYAHDGSLPRDLVGEGSFHQVLYSNDSAIPSGSTVASVKATVVGFIPNPEPHDVWSGRFYWALNSVFPLIGNLEGENNDTRTTAPDGTAWTVAKVFQTQVGLEITAGYNPTNPTHRFTVASITVTFTLPLPSATTVSAIDITQVAGRMRGTYNPNGATSTFPMSYKWEYGLTTSYGNSTTPVTGITGSASTDVSHLLSGLTANTTYHYRFVAYNADGTTNGSDMTFTTNTREPLVMLF